MRWDYLFSKAVLQRGMEYYKTKRVSSVMKRGATYQAAVIGNGRRYDVEVYLTDSIHPTLYCNCDYAASGLHCKHMAAVMCAIDDGFVERQEETAKLLRVLEDEKEIAGWDRMLGSFHDDDESWI